MWGLGLGLLANLGELQQGWSGFRRGEEQRRVGEATKGRSGVHPQAEPSSRVQASPQTVEGCEVTGIDVMQEIHRTTTPQHSTAWTKK